MENLWPENLTVTKTKAPVTVLREQASLLGEATQNIVEANVFPIRDSNTEFRYAFHIVAPPLGNYQYKLFTICHGIDMYPVTICPDEDIIKEVRTVLPKQNAHVLEDIIKEVCTFPPKQNEHVLLKNQATLVAGSEAEFIEILKAIFHSKRTVNIIQAIVAQTTAL